MFENYDRIHFDIGANEGVFAVQIAKNEPKTYVVAFEPIPKLVYSIKEKVSHLKNFMILRNAVSNFNGEAKFNISPESQYGDFSCSSLLDFSDKSKTDWPGREDFKVIDDIEVDVIRLDSVIVEYKIPKIDYLKIDTQGYEMEVLKGSSKILDIIDSLLIEVSLIELYEGQELFIDILEFLKKKNFKIWSLDRVMGDKNTGQTYQLDIFFVKDAVSDHI